MLRFLGRLVIFSALLLVVLELFFRFAVPGARWPSRIQDEKYGVMHFDTSDVRDGLYTSGRIAQQRSHWHINNEGWNSPIDYSSPHPGRKPVIAIIGSSYVEGFHVDGKDRVAGSLQRDLHDRYEVYSIGQAGAALGQFMNLARYAAAKFDPDVFVLVLEDGDLRAALRKNGVRPRDLQLDLADGQPREIPPARSRDGGYKKYLRYSSFAWYLTANAHLTLFGGDAAGNVEQGKGASADSPGDSLRVKAANYIAQRMAEDHPGKPIIFVIDGPRSDIYQGKVAQSPPLVNLMRTACRDSNEFVLDLTPIWQQRYASSRRKFNFDHDYHWNAYGHQVCAEAIGDFLREKKLITP
jgi:hypothetical protein